MKKGRNRCVFLAGKRELILISPCSLCHKNGFTNKCPLMQEGLREAEDKTDIVEDRRKSQHAFVLTLQVARKTWDLGVGKAKCPAKPLRVTETLSQERPRYHPQAP